NLLDAAQRKGADHAIKGPVLERQPFTANDPPIHLHPPLPDSLFGPALHAHVWFDHGEAANPGGIMRYVQAGSKTNFQNPAAGGGSFPGLKENSRLQTSGDRGSCLGLRNSICTIMLSSRPGAGPSHSIR